MCVCDKVEDEIRFFGSKVQCLQWQVENERWIKTLACDDVYVSSRNTRKHF